MTLKDTPVWALDRVQSVMPSGGLIMFEIVRHWNAEVAAFLRSYDADYADQFKFPVVHNLVDSTIHPDIRANPGRWKSEHPERTDESMPKSESNLLGVFLEKEAARQTLRNHVSFWIKEHSPSEIPEVLHVVETGLMCPYGRGKKIIWIGQCYYGMVTMH